MIWIYSSTIQVYPCRCHVCRLKYLCNNLNISRLIKFLTIRFQFHWHGSPNATTRWVNNNRQTKTVKKQPKTPLNSHIFNIFVVFVWMDRSLLTTIFFQIWRHASRWNESFDLFWDRLESFTSRHSRLLPPTNANFSSYLWNFLVRS